MSEAHELKRKLYPSTVQMLVGFLREAQQHARNMNVNEKPHPVDLGALRALLSTTVTALCEYIPEEVNHD